MESKKVYEYVVVKEWLAGLEKGSRLYYDLSKGTYFFHTEREDNYGSDFYTTYSFTSHDTMLSIDSVNHLIEDNNLIAGPEFGEVEYDEEEKRAE